MSYATINGRNISKRWLARYHPQPAVDPGHVRRWKKKPEHEIYAAFHMPEIPGTGEEAETRIVRINGYAGRDWIEDMCGNYFELWRSGLTGLTTFFPNYP